MDKKALIFTAHENTVFPMAITAEKINFQITLIIKLF